MAPKAGPKSGVAAGGPPAGEPDVGAAVPRATLREPKDASLLSNRVVRARDGRHEIRTVVRDGLAGGLKEPRGPVGVEHEGRLCEP